MVSLSHRKTLILLLSLLIFHVGSSLSTSPSTTTSSTLLQSQKRKLSSRKSLLAYSQDKDDKLISISGSNAQQTKKKTILETKNQTKTLKPKKSNSTIFTISTIPTTISTKLKLPKLNKTLNAKSKPSNSTKVPKTPKPTKSNSTLATKTELKTTKKTLETAPLSKQKQSTKPKNLNATKPTKPDHPALLDETDGDDLISDLPDIIERLSTTSRIYLSAARPYLGNRFAPIIAPLASALFLVVPLLLLAALVKRLGSYLSIVRRLLIFIQAYLAIYFATLAVTALVTGLEPLRFFYATSTSSYTWTQVAQSLGYVVYLVLQLADLVAVYSSDVGEGSRALALAQMLVGLAVGLHYYAAVFHRAVMGEAPRANWCVHGAYAACFLLICACARAERRKKAYVSMEGTEEWKKS